ncbi:MAG: methyltransferase [Myxococcota bacterium]
MVKPNAATERSLVSARPSWWSSLVERYFALRNRIVASERFQRWAAGFPLTRWVAQKRAMALFDICAGFVYSQILYACVTLDIFERLADASKTVAQLCKETNMPAPGMRRLLDGAVALRLLEHRGGERYGLGTLGAALRGNPGVARMIEHHPMLYRDLDDPLALLRGRDDTELGAFWAYASTDDPRALDTARVTAYSRLMAESQQFIARDVLEAYPLHRHRRLLDVGGGRGAFLIAAARKCPDLELSLFDLPAVADQATEFFKDAGLELRAQAVGGDVFSDVLPTGADVLSLVRIVHDHDDDAAMAILRSAHQALPRGGVLLLAEPMARTRGAQAMGDAYFGFYLLAMGHGQPRSPNRLRDMVLAAGFSSVELRPTRRPMLTKLLVARRD